MPKYHKLQRGICLALFLASSIASYFNPHMLYIAALSIFGVAQYDIVCYLKEKTAPKDFGPEIKEIKELQEDLVTKLQAIRDDASLGKLAETFRRNK